MRFYLGTHQPTWLERLDVPLFLSRRALERRVRLPVARGPWALDSGGFSELTLHGRWMLGPRDYVGLVRRYALEVGHLEWATVQDWMCEPHMLQRTGKTVAEHQSLTVASYLTLRALAPEIRWMPVLQGYLRHEYLEHLEQYLRAGVDLAALDVVGLGSVCRRQDTRMAQDLARELARGGLRLHGFGIKSGGLKQMAPSLASADSLSWSFQARRLRRPAFPECKGSHINCANCARYALDWRRRLLAGVDAPLRGGQLPLFAWGGD